MDFTLDSIRDIKIYQSVAGYRFSVDSLLLPDFVALRKVGSIADLGAGGGIIGLLLAGKYPGAVVTLFELQESLAALAEKNVLLNNLENSVRVEKCDIRTLCSTDRFAGRYDLVVSNPPFRRPGSGLRNMEEERAIARHEIKLNIVELVRASACLLRSKGRFCFIHHPDRLPEIMNSLRKSALEPKRMRFVHSSLLSGAKMVMIEAVREGQSGLKIEKPFYIYNMDGSYTDEMSTVYNNS
jgi:tRNA1Val (adenine37-N6)-methyltransferase